MRSRLQAQRRFLEAGLGFLDVGQDAHTVLVIAGAVRRQTDAPRGAVQQTHAQQAFEVLDDGGDGGARKGKAVGRPVKLLASTTRTNTCIA